MDLLVSPDKGGIERAKRMGGILEKPWMALEKRRIDSEHVELSLPKDVPVALEGKHIVIVDDVISTGGIDRRSRPAPEAAAGRRHHRGVYPRAVPARRIRTDQGRDRRGVLHRYPRQSGREGLRGPGYRPDPAPGHAVGLARPVPSPVRASEVPADRLLELTHALRRSLTARGEYLPPVWVEEAANDLRTGSTDRLGTPQPAGGLAVVSIHGARAVGHLHVEPGPEASQRGVALLAGLRAAVPRDALRSDVGVTGLTDEEEQAVAVRL